MYFGDSTLTPKCSRFICLSLYSSINNLLFVICKDVFNYITSPKAIAKKHADESKLDGGNLEVINFEDGGQYIGLIKNNMPTSLGIFRYSDGKYDIGHYKNGKLHGLGRLNIYNGDIYDGFLSEGLFDGRGVFYQRYSD